MIYKIIVLSLAFGLSLAVSPLEALAKTVNGGAGKSADEKSGMGVAGPAPQKATTQKFSTQPSKKVLRKTKIVPPPLMHDPN